MVVDTNPNGRVIVDEIGMIMLRVRRFIAFRVRPCLYRESRPVTIRAWTVDGEPVPFAEAVAQEFLPFNLGSSWGRAWDTVWFELTGDAPQEWPAHEREIIMDLGFIGDQPGFQAEALAYTADGRVIKGIEPLNAWIPLPESGAFTVFVEAAANPIVQVAHEYEPTALGDLSTAGSEPRYRLVRAEVARRDLAVWELLQDVSTLDGLVDTLPPAGARRAQIAHALDRMVDSMDPDDIAGTAAAGRAALAGVLTSATAGSALEVSAVGHAHIDCAWLWPTRETERKVARTFANVLDLIDRFPDFIFAASSAQQYAWLKRSHPDLFERVRRAVATGNIRPVGGMWVESDTNMPSGESLVRQLLLGKRFFLDEFGVETDEGWLPDSFGYTAALPQILQAAGIRYFLTQKPSWNEVNPMPHSSFIWEGIDGSRVFTHFPPSETYNSDLGALDLDRSERSFKEKGQAKNVLALFGWGDGGGGPTREMLAAAARKTNLDGSPRVTLTDPSTFFRAAEAELAEPAVWTGEMYLELHRGTLTSQQKTKRGNRRSEALLHEAELWCAAAAVLHGASYPYEELETIWQVVLLQQFHDILPGSSIAWVHQEAEQEYARVERELTAMIDGALSALAGKGDTRLLANASPVGQHGAPAFSLAPADITAHARPSSTAEGWALEDEQLRAVIDQTGSLVSLFDKRAGRELIPDGHHSGVLQLFRDTPREWDAWDINEEDQRNGVDLLIPVEVTVEEAGVRVRYEHGMSHYELTMRLSNGRLEYQMDIDWQESQKLLKFAFPLDIRAERAASEIQFGHLNRPTQRNTSWDTARFETVAHRWIHVGEPDYGVAIANDVVYGHDVRTSGTPSGRVVTTTRLSLLRAPRYPDPGADNGRHTFSVSIRPGGIAQAIEDGYAQQYRPRSVVGTPVVPLVSVDNPAIVIETIKLAEDRSGDLIVRAYESRGNRSRGQLRAAFSASGVTPVDLLERTVESEAVRLSPGGSIAFLELRPFELITLRFSRQ